MHTILFVLTVAVLVFYIFGAVSLCIETKATDFYEFFVLYNGWIVTALGAINAVLVTFFCLIGGVGSTQAFILVAYFLLALVAIGFTVYQFIKHGEVEAA